MDPGQAVCAWIRTFEGCGSVASLGDLRDGVVLSRIWGEITVAQESPADDAHETTSTSPGSSSSSSSSSHQTPQHDLVVLPLGEEAIRSTNWAVWASRLRLLVSRVAAWYRRELGARLFFSDETASSSSEGSDGLFSFDAELAARAGDERELMKLTELVLGAAVQSPSRRAEFVGRIMRDLADDEQAALMVVVDRVLKTTATARRASSGSFQEEEHQQEASSSSQTSSSSSSRPPGGGVRLVPTTTTSEEEAETKGEPRVVVSTGGHKDKAETGEDADDAAAALRTENETLRRRVAELVDERDELQRKWSTKGGDDREGNNDDDDENEKRVSYRDRLADAERGLRAAEAQFRDAAADAERERREREDAERRAAELTAQTSRIKARCAALEDDLDVARAARAELTRAEARVATLTKKCDEAATLRRDNRELEAQNEKYLREIVQLEEKHAQAERAVKDVDELSKRLHKADKALFEKTAELKVKDAEVARCRDDRDQALEAKRFFEDELKALAKQTTASSLHDKNGFGGGTRAGAASSESLAATAGLLCDETEDDSRRDGRHSLGVARGDDDDDDNDASGSTNPSMRARVAKLERDNARLRVSLASSDDEKGSAVEVARLRAALDDREQVALDARRAQADLEAECARLRQALALEAERTSRGDEEGDKATRTEEPRAAISRRDAAANTDNEVDDDADDDDDAADARQLLEEKDKEIARLAAERAKLEAHTRKTLDKVQDKYATLVQTYKTQIKEKQDRIGALEARLRADRDNHRREEALVASAVYDLGQRLIEHNLAELHPTAPAAT